MWRGHSGRRNGSGSIDACRVGISGGPFWKPKWSVGLLCPLVKIISRLAEEQTYDVTFESNNYQVEVKLLENTDQYIHVIVAVDDGSLLGAMRPLSSSFVRRKGES
jgi:hypothetical protein